MEDEYHIIPRDDMKPHSTSITCRCEPYVDGEVIVHNAWDGREFYEGESEH